MGFDLAVVGGDGSAVAAQLCTAAVNSLGRNESSVSVLVLCDARLVDENAAKSMLQTVRDSSEASVASESTAACRDLSQNLDDVAEMCGSLKYLIIITASSCVSWWGEAKLWKHIRNEALELGRGCASVAPECTAGLLRSLLPLCNSSDSQACAVMGTSTSSSIGSALETAAAAATEALLLCAQQENPFTICRLFVDKIPSAGKLSAICSNAALAIQSKEPEFALIPPDQKGDSSLNNSMSMSASIRPQANGIAEIHNPPSIDGSTLSSPLLRAIFNDDKASLKTLLKAIKRPEDITAENDEHGRNALHVAAAKGQEGTLSSLLKKKPDANVKDTFGWTPLMYAVQAGDHKTVRTVLKGGGDPNILSADGQSPVHLLCMKKITVSPDAPTYKKEREAWESLMKVVLDLGADINQRDGRGVTPLMLVVTHASAEVVKWMIKHEADVTRKDRSKRTALHAAVEKKQYSVCAELLKAGADPNAGAGEECGSCFDRAMGNEKMLNMLEEFRDVNARDSESLETLLRKREPVWIKDPDDFPDLAQKHIKIAELDRKEMLDNMDTLIYCLRFLLKQNFKLHGEEDKPIPLMQPKSMAKTLEMKSSNLDDLLERYVDNGNPRRMFKALSQLENSQNSINCMAANQSFSPSPPPRLLNLMDESGHGGFGSVFVAKPVQGKEKVAIKRMSHDTEKEMRNNGDEIVHLKRCDHPNICKFHNAYISRGEMWIIMEYLEGGTLAQASDVGKLNEAQIAYVTQEILKGIKYMHSLNLVHRDLKSANIMMTIDGDIKIIDFGLCVDLGVGEQKSLVGSPFWIPPEMVQRKPHSKPADIWSLAILCLEMANQRPPNRRSALRAMFNAGTGQIPQLEDPSKWGNTFKDFLSRMLKTDPEERWTADQLLRHKWLKRADSRRGMRNIIHSIFIGRSLESSLGIGGL